MPGNGSCFDRNDWELIERLTKQVGRAADELKRYNDLKERELEEIDE